MAVLYSPTSVSGYNANPPPDDGTTVSTNLITWAGIKSKIGDPLNTFDTSVDANITAAFGKTLDGSSLVSTGVNYNATAADQGRLIVATASGITVMTPDATVVTAPFSFAINNRSSGTINVDGFGAQTVDGLVIQVIQPGSGCILKTDGSNWFTYGLKPAQISVGGSSQGFNVPVNLQLQASVSTNILTIAVKTVAGNDPSAGDPVLIPFRDVTLANGDPVWVTLASALSITTNAVGATLGTQNAVPFRFWILLLNNAGTPVLALWHSGAGAATLSINPLNESVLRSTTGISAAATSSGVIYTPNGVTLSNLAFRIVGFLDYAAGLATAGTYNIAPTTMQLFGPGIKKPGDVIQTGYATSSTQTTHSGDTSFVSTTPSVSITPSSSTSLVRALATGSLKSSGANPVAAELFRTAGASPGTGTGFGPVIENLSGGGIDMPCTLIGLDAPSSSSQQTYNVGVRESNAGGTVSWLSSANLTQTGTILVEEIMA